MVTGSVAVDRFAPSAAGRTRLFDAGVVVGSLLVALCAQLAVPVPMSPVPITGQTFGVLVVGALLGCRRGAAALALYALEGACGLPVFAGLRAGFPVLAGPTGGYILGFIAAAAVTGALAERGWDRRFLTAVSAMSIGTAVIFAFGVAWLSVFVGAASALPMGLVPFLPGAVIKIAAAASVLPVGWRWLGRRGE